MIISRVDVEKCLSQKNMTEELLECQKRLVLNLVSHDEQISVLARKKVKTSSIDNDISALILQVINTERKTNQELVSFLQKINLQIELAEHINICFEVSKFIYPMGYVICLDLLKNRCSWDYIVSTHNIARSSITKYKEREFLLILILYAMYEPNIDLFQKWNVRFSGVRILNHTINVKRILEKPELVLTDEEMQKVCFD